jgi:hypothetical protein
MTTGEEDLDQPDGADRRPLRKLVGGQQLSEACVSGTIQLPPDGNPLILLAEHQTTGGYKVPGVVIRADLWKVGQMRPGDSLRFVETTPEEATAALRDLLAKAIRTEPRPLDSRFLDLQTLSQGVNQMGDNRFQHNSAAYFLLSLRTGAELKQIDLNADCGEGFDDAGLMKYVTSVNVACGGHVGTPGSISKTVALAAAGHISIGAHVSFDDKEGFGRRALDTSPEELRAQVLWQASALDGLCRGAGTRVRYIKPHGGTIIVIFGTI